MALGDVIARLAVSLTMETAAFEKGASLAEKRLEQSRKRFESIGKSMTSLGTKLSLGLTAPLAALGAASYQAAQESADALGQVTSALESMGDASGRTTEQLQALAATQMGQSLYDDDEILRKVTANLLTFGQISGETFDRAQQAAIDLSARLGTDLQSSAILVGKALNDPVKGVSALTRVGVSFTEEQKKQIKAMAEAGNVAGAQALILSELQNQYAGAAAAARAADPTAASKQAWAEFQETIGAFVIKVLPPLTEFLTKVLDKFNNLSPSMQKVVVIGGALAAALGPVLTVLGGLIQIAAPALAFIKLMAGLLAAAETAGAAAAIAGAGFGSLAASFATLLGPVAAVAAAGYLIYQNWDKIAPVLQGLWQTIQQTIGPPLQRLIEALTTAANELWQGAFGDAVRAAMPYLATFAQLAAQALGHQVVSTIKLAAAAIGLAFDAIALSVRAVTSLFDGTFKRMVIDAVRAVSQGVKLWLQDKLGQVFDWVRDKVKLVGDAFAWLYDVVVGHSYIPDMVDGIAAQIARLDAVMVKPVKNATEAAGKAFKDLRDLLDRLFPEAGKASAFNADLARIANSSLSAAEKDEAVARLWREFASGSPFGSGGMGKPDFGDAGPLVAGMGKTEDAIQRLTDKAKIGTVRIAESFKDMADKTLGALSNLTSAIKGGGFLNILEGVIGLGLQLGSIGAFGKTIAGRINAVPKYAGGTNFHPGGMALVGERGPELVSMPRGSRVIPNAQLGGKQLIEIVDTTGLFRMRVNGQILEAAPAIAQAGAQGGVALGQYKQSRRWRS